ncbi:serpin family protein [Streptomyces xanthochromogenes]|uniref:serpin family protein n=1 Tax=Streptomyces xanthochromogenes TaxID=67384 RepID=UPI00379B3C38
MTSKGAAIAAANALAARWAREHTGTGDTVFSAAAVWPLLALLAAGAHGPARAELADAVGLRPEEAAAGARALLSHVHALPGVHTAAGLWTKRTLELRPGWSAQLPPGTHGVLTDDPAQDREALDAWASRHTDGLITSMPVTPSGETRLVLAAAQAVRTRWLRPFQDGSAQPESGPWAGRELVALHRRTALLDRVAVAHTGHGPLTVLKVLGDTGVDVHLLLGERDLTASQVLTSGLDVLAGHCPAVPGDRLPDGAAGPGLTVGNVRSTSRDPELDVTAPPFDLRAEHDLPASARLFGLETATDSRTGHFDGISPDPLALGSARQAATATFTELGFRAGSVTALEVAAGGLPPRPRYSVRRVEATFDRPFGFLAVHRTSRLVLTAGWVDEPVPLPPWDESEWQGGHEPRSS